MSKILIIGESGERPWFDDVGSKRLWSWFNAKTYEELLEKADLMNVMPHKGDKAVDSAHLRKVFAAVEMHDQVYLIGKKAQILVTGNYDKRLMWHEGKFVGMPHPSGLNRQVNTLDIATVRALVKLSLNIKEGVC